MAGESLNLQQFYAENGDCSLILGPGDDAPVASLVELEVEEDNEAYFDTDKGADYLYQREKK